MQIVQALADATVYDQSGSFAYQLQEGSEYLLYDHEAALGRQQGAVELIHSLDRHLPFYRGESLTCERILMPFVGRLGDLLVCVSCLCSLLDRYPGATVDIACTESARNALALLATVGRTLPYPIGVDHLDEYSYYMTFEDVEAQPRGARRSYADVFSACLHTPRPSQPASLTIPPEALEKWSLPGSAHPKIAVVAGDPNSLRTYPMARVHELADELIAEDLNVYLLGKNVAGPTASSTQEIGSACLSDQTEAHCNDLINKTPSFAEYAAVISQMNAVVTGDSLPLHVAGSLGVPTVALFTATDRIIAADYLHATAVQSGADCSPCFVADGGCPLGHPACVAHNDKALAPQRIASLVRSLVESGAVTAPC